MFALLIAFEMCLAQVSLESKQTPNTFIDVPDLTVILFEIVSTGGVSFFYRKDRLLFLIRLLLSLILSTSLT